MLISLPSDVSNTVAQQHTDVSLNPLSIFLYYLNTYKPEYSLKLQRTEELGSELAYFPMESLECSNLEHSEYYGDAIGPAYWPCPPPEHTPTENFNSDSIISSEGLQQWDESWPNCVRESPPISEQSLLSQAPSSHTSYDGGDSVRSISHHLIRLHEF